MHLENRESPLVIRLVDKYLTVKTPGTQQSRIKNFRPVGRCKYDNRRIGSEAIHFGEKLIKCLFSLIVSTHLGSGGTAFSDRIDLIDEDNGGCLFFGLFEKIPDAACADTDEHFDKA